jgi:hypothetical protein
LAWIDGRRLNADAAAFLGKAAMTNGMGGHRSLAGNLTSSHKISLIFEMVFRTAGKPKG